MRTILLACVCLLVFTGCDDGEIEKALAAKRVHGLEWEDTNLDQAVAYLRTITGVSFYITPKVREERFDDVLITLKLGHVPIRNVLDLVTEPFDLRWDVRQGVIWILTREELEQPAPKIEDKRAAAYMEAARYYALGRAAEVLKHMGEAEAAFAEALQALEPLRGKSAYRWMRQSVRLRLQWARKRLLDGARKTRLWDETLLDMQTIEIWLSAAIEAFEEGRYLEAEDYASRVLARQNDHAHAAAVDRAARGQRTHPLGDIELALLKHRFRSWIERMLESRSLEEQMLDWPSRAHWERFAEALAPYHVTWNEGREGPRQRALQETLKTSKISLLRVSNEPFPNVVKAVGALSGLSLQVDPRIASKVENAPVTLILQDAPLHLVLDALAGAVGRHHVEWIAREEGVWFTRRDLTAFPLVSREVKTGDLSGPSEGPAISTDDLWFWIVNGIAPAFWERKEGADVQDRGEGTLVVTATPLMHAAVDAYLAALREAQARMK